MKINAKELRQHLGDYLEQAARGNTVDISMRGKPVARLTAIDKTDAVSAGGNDALFGIWADRKDVDVDKYVRELRRGRQF